MTTGEASASAAAVSASSCSRVVSGKAAMGGAYGLGVPFSA